MIPETIALLPSILHVTKQGGRHGLRISEKQFRSGLHLKAFARRDARYARLLPDAGAVAVGGDVLHSFGARNMAL